MRNVFFPYQVIRFHLCYLNVYFSVFVIFASLTLVTHSPDREKNWAFVKKPQHSSTEADIKIFFTYPNLNYTKGSGKYKV